MHFAEKFQIDPDKINTVEDVAQVLDALDIRVAPDFENFEQLEPYLTEIEEDERQNTTYD
jgi:hypothetical protein